MTDANLLRVVSIVLHFIFFPFLVRYPSTLSALNSAGSVSVNALSTQSKCAKCAVVDTAHVFLETGIRYTLKGSIQSFERTWTPFLSYYDSIQTPLQEKD